MKLNTFLCFKTNRININTKLNVNQCTFPLHAIYLSRYFNFWLTSSCSVHCQDVEVVDSNWIIFSSLFVSNMQSKHFTEAQGYKHPECKICFLEHFGMERLGWPHGVLLHFCWFVNSVVFNESNTVQKFLRNKHNIFPIKWNKVYTF